MAVLHRFTFIVTKTIATRNCVYETLCRQPLACPPSCSPGNLFTILLQLTKSEATSCNSFRDILVGNFRCPNLQRALTQKNAKTITYKKFFLIFTSNPLITLYQLANFGGGGGLRYHVFCRNLQRAITKKMNLYKFSPSSYLLSSIS